MQYTASSFAQPLTSLFAGVLRVRAAVREAPGAATFAARSEDAAETAWARFFSAVGALALRLRPVETGSTQRYVLYTALAAILLLVWRLV
jgi:hypothetical protein